ncbi:hypothetical protein AVEN_235440-2-1, partial [Araneus ventricosus]
VFHGFDDRNSSCRTIKKIQTKWMEPPDLQSITIQCHQGLPYLINVPPKIYPDKRTYIKFTNDGLSSIDLSVEQELRCYK